jgi:hypothetical protein
MRARYFVAVLASAAFSNSPVQAQGSSSCPVPVGNQIKAVAAFAEMLPTFRHPRCLNCHGGMDVSSAAHPGADQIEPNSNPLAFSEQCQQCHDGLPGWRQPGSPVFFTDKDDEELCLQMKRFEHTGDEFVEHIHNDHGGIQFIAAAFVGDRALGEGLQDYRLSIERPPGSQAELTAKARKWVDLLGDGYSASPECGCVVKLEGKFTYTDSLSGAFSDATTVTGDLVWKADEAGKSQPTFGDAPSVFFKPVEGHVTVKLQFDNMAIGGPGNCEGQGSRTFSVDQMTRGALRVMQLEVAADGRYKFTLVIPDTPDPFPRWQFTANCKGGGRTWTAPMDVRYTSVVVGRREGTVDAEGNIKGKLPAPIRRGVRKVEAEWSFKSP